ncbi:ABC transporter ATP-binding protein, partial [Enterococcus faecalis]
DRYRFILNQSSDLTQLFMDTKEYFRIEEIVKETMSLRDLYIHYREGGL